MPQVFGAEELALVATASLWVDAAELKVNPNIGDMFQQFIGQEGFRRETSHANPDQAKVAKGRITYSKDLGVKTIGDKPAKIDGNGQLTNGNGYHEFVVHLDNSVPEGNKETSTGGKTRYELSYHHVDRNGRLTAQTIWSGNTPHGLNNAHERIKSAMGRIKQ